MDATAPPTTIRAGDSVAWRVELAAYLPADGWALHYRLLWPTGAAVSFDATADGTAHAVSLTSADTASWAAGSATLVSWVEQGADRVTLAQQPVQLLPDLTAAANFDSRTQNEIALADCQQALADYLASGKAHVAGYGVAGRTMTFRSTDEIRALIEHYQREVARERANRAALSGGSPGRIMVRM